MGEWYEPRNMLSPLDDHPVHQVPDFIRHVGTSDRNFYDRYYFNCHHCSDDLFLVMGMGQYPNLSVQDAFAVVRRGRDHRVVRASRTLGDRQDTTVGPFRIEVLEGLKRLRFVLEPNPHEVAFDLTFDGSIPAFEEPRQYIRRHGRVLFDTVRFAQTGRWSGRLEVGHDSFEVSPDTWWGNRDRSWGIRPVGEPEAPGIRAGALPLDGMWNYAPVQFDDFSLLYMCHERSSGERPLEEAVRIWNDPERAPEWLGRPEHRHEFKVGTREIERSTLLFPEAPGGGWEMAVTPLLPLWVAVGTGYGMEAEWRHGMYQGELAVEGEKLDLENDRERFWGLVDSVARFELGNHVGYGLFEYGIFGPYAPYGFKEFMDGAR
jgi:hypothetical protein